LLIFICIYFYTNIYIFNINKHRMQSVESPLCWTSCSRSITHSAGFAVSVNCICSNNANEYRTSYSMEALLLMVTPPGGPRWDRLQAAERGCGVCVCVCVSRRRCHSNTCLQAACHRLVSIAELFNSRLNRERGGCSLLPCGRQMCSFHTPGKCVCVCSLA